MRLLSLVQGNAPCCKKYAISRPESIYSGAPRALARPTNLLSYYYSSISLGFGERTTRPPARGPGSRVAPTLGLLRRLPYAREFAKLLDHTESMLADEALPIATKAIDVPLNDPVPLEHRHFLLYKLTPFPTSRLRRPRLFCRWCRRRPRVEFRERRHEAGLALAPYTHQSTS